MEINRLTYLTQLNDFRSTVLIAYAVQTSGLTTTNSKTDTIRDLGNTREQNKAMSFHTHQVIRSSDWSVHEMLELQVKTNDLLLYIFNPM